MEQKPNENGAEAADDGLFTSATRVQIPLGTQENQVVSSESAEPVSGDRRGDSNGETELFLAVHTYAEATYDDGFGYRYDSAARAKLIEAVRAWASGAKVTPADSEQSGASSANVRVCAACRRDYSICICECGPSDGVMPVDAAMRQVEKRAAYAEEGSDLFSARVLAAEVQRLREVGCQSVDLLEQREAEVSRLCEALRDKDAAYLEACEAQELELVQLRNGQHEPCTAENQRLREHYHALRDDNDRLREQDEKTRGMYAAAAWDRECLQKRRNKLEQQVTDLREENARLKAEVEAERSRAVAADMNAVAILGAAPRYSTEAVDAYIEYRGKVASHWSPKELGLFTAMRASREPKS